MDADCPGDEVAWPGDEVAWPRDPCCNKLDRTWKVGAMGKFIIISGPSCPRLAKLMLCPWGADGTPDGPWGADGTPDGPWGADGTPDGPWGAVGTPDGPWGADGTPDGCVLVDCQAAGAPPLPPAWALGTCIRFPIMLDSSWPKSDEWAPLAWAPNPGGREGCSFPWLPPAVLG